MKKFSKWMILSLILVLALAFAGCGKEETPASELAAVQEAGVLNIGITLYEPMNYYNEEGVLVGFDTEYAQAVCEILGVEANFVEIDWNSKDIELDAGNIDCLWNGFTVTDDRREWTDFSESYIKNMQVIVIRSADAELYTDTASLAGAKTVAEMGSAGEAAISADENLAASEYTGVALQSTALLEVKSGTADAAVVDYVMACSMTGEGTDYEELMIIPNIELNAEEYAIGFRLGSDLVAAVNTATETMIADGSLQALAEKYDLSLQLIANQQ